MRLWARLDAQMLDFGIPLAPSWAKNAEPHRPSCSKKAPKTSWGEARGTDLLSRSLSEGSLAPFWLILAPFFDRIWRRCLMFRPLSDNVPFILSSIGPFIVPCLLHSAFHRSSPSCFHAFFTSSLGAYNAGPAACAKRLNSLEKHHFLISKFAYHNNLKTILAIHQDVFVPRLLSQYPN